MLRSILLGIILALAACAAPPDPLDPASQELISDRTLERQWRWAHETGRTDADVPAWPSLTDYRASLKKEAIRRHPEWGPFARPIASGRLVHDMTEEQVLWTVGPPSGETSYQFGKLWLTKWVGPVHGLNASWVVIFSDGVVIDIKDRR